MSQELHYHLIGIGGIGMSGIAQLLLQRGSRVSGSDLKPSDMLMHLKNLGADVFIGHNAENIKGADIVIYSSAVNVDNPEIKAALEKGMPVLKRAQALAELMKYKNVVTVAGSHGKTTTASLVSHLLLEAGDSPTIAVGGIFKNIDNNASLGRGEFFVAEADESDGSFLYYRPRYSIITNIDYEHLDYYGSFEKEVDAFGKFMLNTQEDGCLFCCADDANLKKLTAGYPGKYCLFGLKEDAHVCPKDVYIKGLSSEFDCYYKGRNLGKFYLNLGGLHNISNAMAVIALGMELGVNLTIIKKAILGYQGAKRRMDVKFSDFDYTVLDDYAHHPTEIKATLFALKYLNARRVIAVFQPHRYTRTKLLLEEFARSFDSADIAIITDIYAASEEPIEGVTGKGIADKIKEYAPDKQVEFLPRAQITEYLFTIKQPGDLIIVLGAGDIVKVSDELAARIRGQG